MIPQDFYLGIQQGMKFRDPGIIIQCCYEAKVPVLTDTVWWTNPVAPVERQYRRIAIMDRMGTVNLNWLLDDEKALGEFIQESQVQ
jgi:hypothetical protein